MGVMGRCVRAWIVLVCLVVLPVAAYAQSSITGVVRDSSGGVLPGVTVEASSPALIEKVAHGRHRRQRRSTASSICGREPTR